MLKSAYSSPKIRTLAAILRIPFPQAVGMCGMLWNFAADHAPQGDVGKHSNHEIAMALEWAGDHDALIDALRFVRLLDDHPNPRHRLLVHDWTEHCPRYVRATLSRKGLSIIEGLKERTAVATAVATTVPTAVVTTSSSSSTSTSTSSASEAQAAPASAPTRGKPRSKPTDPIAWHPEAGWSGITEADRAAWAAAYPACDIPRQLAAMGEWLRANPAKARKSAWRRFVSSWLSRSQDRGGDVAASVPGRPRQKVESW